MAGPFDDLADTYGVLPGQPDSGAVTPSAPGNFQFPPQTAPSLFLNGGQAPVDIPTAAKTAASHLIAKTTPTSKSVPATTPGSEPFDDLKDYFITGGTEKESPILTTTNPDDDLFGGATKQAEHAFTFGLTTPMEGLANAVVGKARDLFDPTNPDAAKSFGDLYREGVDTEQGKRAVFADQHPYLSAAATGVGLLGSVGPFKNMDVPATLPLKIWQGAKVGAPIGALAGAANSPGEATGTDVAKNAGVGSLWGGILGGAFPAASYFLAPIVQRIGSALGLSPNSQALAAIAARVHAGQSGGGPGVQDIATSLASAPGKPVTVADYAGEEPQALLGSVLRTPGPARQFGTDFLRSRDSDTATRMLSDVDGAFGGGDPTYTAAKNLATDRATAAAPLYSEAYSANPVIASPEIDRILNTKEGRQAMSSAVDMMQSAGKNVAVPDPALTQRLKETTDLGLTEPGTSPGGVAPGLKLQTLDYIKQAMDDIWRPLRGTNQGRIVRNNINSLLGELDNADSTAIRDPNGNITTPGKYAQARSVWSNSKSAEDALEEGGKIYSKAPDQIEDEINSLSPNERDFYTLGAANAIKARVMKTPSKAGDESNVILRNQYIQQAIRPLFANQQDFDTFINSKMRPEQQMWQTTNKTLGNSATAARIAEDTNPEGGELSRAAVSLAGGEPINAVWSGLKAIHGLATGRSPAVNTEIAKQLLSTDPVVQQKLLSSIDAYLNRGNRQMLTTVPFASIGPSTYVQPATSALLARMPFGTSQQSPSSAQ